jgi:hypothetical protein
MDLGLALKAAASATTTFSAGAESGRSASALRPSGLRRADPNSGFSGDLSSTLASRPPRSRPSSLDQRAEPSASQPAAASRENARNSSADAFHGDLASVLSGARRQVIYFFFTILDADVVSINISLLTMQSSFVTPWFRSDQAVLKSGKAIIHVP